MLQNKGIDGKIIPKGYRGHPLTDAQKSVNQVLSKARGRVERIFGFVTQNRNDFYLYCIGLKRATGQIGLINLTYNLCRYEQIMRLNLLPIK
ncbi:MAG: transposase [Bacteroidales bacterium]|jgi:hypothetical protein|nr:transposase [Bacteroidales bacterium]